MQVVGADPLSERGRPLPLELHNLCSGGPAGVMAMARDKGRDTQSREIHFRCSTEGQLATREGEAGPGGSRRGS
jgi:hypothetical protein